jgi:hypothetical protein
MTTIAPNPNQEEVNERNGQLISEHQQWLQHPITKLAFALIKANMKSIGDTIVQIAPAGTDAALRITANRLAAYDDVRTALGNSQEFVKAIEKAKVQ